MIKATGITIIVAAMLMLGGCTTTSELRTMTSGQIGCPPEELEIKGQDIGLFSGSWTATCRGKTYFCSGTAASTSCKESLK